MINFIPQNAKKKQIYTSISFAFFKKNYTIMFIHKIYLKVWITVQKLFS